MTARIAVALAAVLAGATLLQAQSSVPGPAQLGRPMPAPSPLPAVAAQVRAQSSESEPAQLGQPMPSQSTMPPTEEPSMWPQFSGPADSDSSADRMWVTADYMAAFTRASSLPPLVTTSPAGTAQAAAGVLGQPNTTILFGNSNVNGDYRSGFRFGAGGWFDADHTWGIDTGFFVLESTNTLFTAASQGNPILARPFTDTGTNTPASQLIAFPGVGAGSITASDGSGNLYSIHVDFEESMFAGAGYRIESLLGYHFLRYTDRLAMDQTVVSAGGGGVVPGTQIVTSDRFTAQNNFHGADLGFKTELFSGPWSLEIVSKLALGNVNRSIGIDGTTKVTVPGSPSAGFNGGFLALASNTGVFGSNDWVAVPEFDANLHWQITRNLRLGLGYTFLYWSQIVHAADQVSIHLDPNQFPPPRAPGILPAAPTPQPNKSEIWVQSINLGLEYRY